MTTDFVEATPPSPQLLNHTFPQQRELLRMVHGSGCAWLFRVSLGLAFVGLVGSGVDYGD